MESIYDFTKEEKALYQPKTVPSLIDVPEMVFLAVDGAGNPNEESGAYADAVSLLYALSYTIKMSDKGGHAIGGFFAYRVPPLEGLWQMAGGQPGVFGLGFGGPCAGGGLAGKRLAALHVPSSRGDGLAKLGVHSPARSRTAV